MILTFGIAGIGVVAWLVGRSVRPGAPIPQSAMGMLAALIVLVVGAAVYVGAQAKPDVPSSSTKVEASGGGVAVGGNVSGTTINTGRPPASDSQTKP